MEGSTLSTKVRRGQLSQIHRHKTRSDAAVHSDQETTHNDHRVQVKELCCRQADGGDQGQDVVVEKGSFAAELEEGNVKLEPDF